MPKQPSLPLRVVDARELGEEYRSVLRPGELVKDRKGRARRLPRFFYEIPSWEVAIKTEITPHFRLFELIDVDVREAEVLRTYPRYVPCAITLLATQLEVFRTAVGESVRIAANGGYRSPGHAECGFATPHSWGAAANLYRVGEDWMDSGEKIEKYSEIARKVLPGIWTRPYGNGEETVFDHVHLDLGYVTVIPYDAPGDEEEPGEDGDGR